MTASSIGLGLSILALYIGYSRRQYYYNHSDDILVGHLTGLVYAVAMGYYAIIRESNKDGTEMEPPLELIRTEWTGDSKPFTTNGTQRSTQQPALNDDAHIHEHSGAGMIPRAYPIQRPAGEINRSFRDESQEMPQTRYY
ncbi:unnamed protein product [Cyprideis torosa]|uniref:Uncharacterized protein n=1 Tax=Cyprideis torosa TaxID=163714 RepID=A0A7R8ZYR0_9CRUS|nr:unnamed protein product [Cyprideis torosa]CAG0908724.1 unnamed protein product [Cyprideis torosa]